jgi:hypothetical protein
MKGTEKVPVRLISALADDNPFRRYQHFKGKPMNPNIEQVRSPDRRHQNHRQWPSAAAEPEAALPCH